MNWSHSQVPKARPCTLMKFREGHVCTTRKSNMVKWKITTFNRRYILKWFVFPLSCWFSGGVYLPIIFLKGLCLILLFGSKRIWVFPGKNMLRGSWVHQPTWRLWWSFSLGSASSGTKSRSEIIWNHCRSLKDCLKEQEESNHDSQNPLHFSIRWISSLKGFLSCGFLMEGKRFSANNFGRTRVLWFINGVRLSPVPIWSIYGMAFETKRISAPGLENKFQTSFLCIQCLMHAILHPSRMNWCFKFQVSSQQEFTCTVQAVPAESLCNCWDHFMKLTIYPIYPMFGTKFPSDHWTTLPPVVSDLNMLSKWTYQLCSGSFLPFHTLNWNKWQICTCRSCSSSENHWIHHVNKKDRKTVAGDRWKWHLK